ncbi:MAG TPA: hypothetical protein VHR16_09585 [Candidatus Limnocylindrales bacterium]|jgi:hypothetical protein|nr:hypothetical protein [Candidatus Limnocylindrales bacterium]
MSVLLPALTAILAFVMAIALLDQWRERRQPFQLVWAIGMTFFGIASGCEALAAAGGWNEGLYRTWYLTGAVLTAGWLGLGTILLLAKTRFGYAIALSIFLAGLFTLLTQRRFNYEGAGSTPILYFIAAGLLALAVAVETYFQNERWPAFVAVGIGAATVLATYLTYTVSLAAPYALDPATGQPVADLFPGSLRLLTPFLNITGGFALAFGALFSAWIFMPKRRVLAYSLDPNQKGDSFIFNLIISLVALPVNFAASLPGALRDLVRGRLHSRVPATLLIALGGFVASAGDSLNRFGITGPFAVAKFLSVVLLLAGFLVSIEAFREIRVPFTGIRLAGARHEPGTGQS